MQEMDIPNSTHQQKDSLTQKKCKNLNTTPEYNWKPKITVKCKHFLYNLSYSEIPNTNDSNTELLSLLKIKKNFNILLYIDIPTIDYYLDELNDSKLSKLNKKFKLNKLKQSIWKSFTNNDPRFWYKLIRSHNNTSSSVINCNLYIKSSGSLRYVETIKFLIETIYDTLSPYKDKITLKIDLNVSRISLKWFKNFLESSVLKTIRFIESPNTLTIPDSPFKEYFYKLNEKFILDEKQLLLSDTIETIIIITNSMGIKALLTILADKPLTHFIDKRSIDQLYNNKNYLLHRPITDSSSRKQTSLGNSTANEYKNGTFAGGVLDRESFSLLNFQKSSLTSNKDRSVRIRSLSINRRSNKLLEPCVNEVPFKTQIISSHKEPLHSISRTKDILQLIDHEDVHQLQKESNNETWLKNNKKSVKTKSLSSDISFISDVEHVFISDEEISEGVVGTSEEEDDNEQEEEEDYRYDDDEGISFYVPSLLSRSGSSSDVNSSSPIHYHKKGRFRSLSLMDPAQRQPFNYDQSFNDSTITTNNKNNVNANNTTENNMIKHKTSSFTNIYIHDGNFNNKHLPKQYKRKYNNIFNPNIISIQSNNGALPIKASLNGMIPPEFYSRLPTPSISEKNSTMALNSSYLSPHNNTNENASIPQINTFDTSLINKSLELNKDNNKPVHNIFNKLINKKNEERNRHFILINSSEHQYVDNHKNNNSSSNLSGLCSSNLLRELEEEDQMLGAVLAESMVTNISQKPSSSVPYKVHESVMNSYSNLNLFNYHNTDKESLKPLYEQSSSTRSNFSLCIKDSNLSDNKTNLQENSDGNDVKYSKESKPTTFKIIASLNLYGSDDEQNDDYSSNIWVLGGNR